MEKIRSICGKALLLFLCTALLLLAGCGGSNPPIEESSSVEEPAPVIELTEENSMEITFVNASDCPVQKLTAWWAGQNEGFDLLHNLDRNLEPDEVIRLRIPKSEDNYYSIGVTEAEYCYTFFPGWSFEYIPEGGIMVLLAGEYPEGYEDIQTIFEAGTDVETAKETALAQFQAACAAELEATQGEEAQEEETVPADLSQEEIDEAVKLLGYDSLADMRTEEHPDIIFRDYDEEHKDYCELYGYWYPNGDRNSQKYCVINDDAVQWYKFDPEKGDVKTDSHRLVLNLDLSISNWKYALDNGDSFTLHRAGVLAALSDGTITFTDGGTEYYYSRY